MSIKKRPNYVISLDIDSTQYSYSDIEHDTASHALKKILEKLVEEGRIYLVHNTGRPFPWKCHGEQVERYLNPIIAQSNRIISNTGTIIWNEDHTPDLEWKEKIETIVPADTVKTLVLKLQDLDYNLHGETFDSDYKISVNTTPSEHSTTVNQLKKIVESEFPGQFDISYWHNRAVDITPSGINKRTALEHVIKTRDLDDVPVLVGGDSMNDYPFLAVPEFNKILVGNAVPELVEAVSHLPNLYKAHSLHRAADGILSGMLSCDIINESDLRQVDYSLPELPTQSLVSAPLFLAPSL